MATTTRRRTLATTTPAAPGACRCRTTTVAGHTQTWPTVHVRHLGDARYVVTRRHHLKNCGMPAEPIDEATWRTAR